MADITKFLPKVLKVEGGFVNDPQDAGGATCKGITLNTFRKYFGSERTVTDLKNITNSQACEIYKKLYWDKCHGDDIKSQSVAELLVDFAVNSGVKTASKKIQTLVGAKPDGTIGDMTVAAINAKKPQTLFEALYNVRVDYFKSIVARKPSQEKFLKGWLNRLKIYKFEN